jgi:hypothetical protein
MTVVVEVERPQLPLLWLDTSILIGIVRHETGNRAADARLLGFLDRIIERQRAGTLLCLRSQQPQEVAGKRHAHRIRERLETLSYGVAIRHRPDCDRRQILAGMQAYLGGQSTITLAPSVFLEQDPDARVRSIAESPMWLWVDSEPHPEVLRQAEEAKRTTHAWLRQLQDECRAERRTFEQQLERERRGFLDGQLAQLDRVVRELASPNPDYSLLAAGVPLYRYVQDWCALGGEPRDFGSFFASDHYTALPCAQIPQQLFASLLVDRQRDIESGDSMDINHMTAALPVATWVVTDRFMASHLERLGLPQRWGATSHSIRSLPSL